MSILLLRSAVAPGRNLDVTDTATITAASTTTAAPASTAARDRSASTSRPRQPGRATTGASAATRTTAASGATYATAPALSTHTSDADVHGRRDHETPAPRGSAQQLGSGRGGERDQRRGGELLHASLLRVGVQQRGLGGEEHGQRPQMGVAHHRPRERPEGQRQHHEHVRHVGLPQPRDVLADERARRPAAARSPPADSRCRSSPRAWPRRSTARARRGRGRGRSRGRRTRGRWRCRRAGCTRRRSPCRTAPPAPPRTRTHRARRRSPAR